MWKQEWSHLGYKLVLELFEGGVTVYLKGERILHGSRVSPSFAFCSPRQIFLNRPGRIR